MVVILTLATLESKGASRNNPCIILKRDPEISRHAPCISAAPMGSLFFEIPTDVDVVGRQEIPRPQIPQASEDLTDPKGCKIPLRHSTRGLLICNP